MRSLPREFRPEEAETLLQRAEGCDALLVGPGMMDGEAVQALAAKLLARLERPAMVIDAPRSAPRGRGR